jgi:two-component system nitrogen regulation sensor histidine kinase NtrY
MGFSRFGFLIGARLIVIQAALGLSGYLLVTPGYPVAMLIALTIAILLSVELFKFVAKTNREVARFLDAARYADFGQRFELSGLGAGFAELGETFTFILDRFRVDRTHQEAELRRLKAMIEHVPVPLLSVHGNNQVTLWNNAARRLFGSQKLTQLEDLAAFGIELPQQIMAVQPGERTMLTLHLENSDQSFSVATSEISMATDKQRLFSLQNIQSELDVTQLQAWQDLVRVLTHEIMNSITPVSSLAKTSADLVEDVRNKVADDAELVAELNDIKNAVDTVARRSDGLMNFVSSYRQLAHLPPPQNTRFLISDLFSDVKRMTTAEVSPDQFALHTKIEPAQLDVYADRQMIEQVLLNLLKNAQHAITGIEAGTIDLVAHLSGRGRVVIEVLDNGPGVPAENANRIFVPFFTTRKEGSGVGLALSRQIMIANGGSLSFSNRVASVA